MIQTLGQVRKTPVSEGAWPGRHLDFRPWAAGPSRY